MISGSICRGTVKKPSSSSSQSRVTRSISMVRLALVTSVTCTPPLAPPVRFHSSQVSIGAEDGLAAFGVGAQAVDVVEHPLQLAAGEVGGRGQACLVPDHLATAVPVQASGDPVGPGVLPDDGVPVRPPGAPVPRQRGFPLVGQAQGGQVGGAQAGRVQALFDDGAGALPDLGGVVLHPAGPGHDLRVLQLVPGHFGAGMVEDHEPGTRGALIDRPDEIGHSISLWWRFTGMSRVASRLTMYIL